MKKENKPRVKHKMFGQLQFRLAGDDWLIGLWNENNKQAMYFLAEPIAGEGAHKGEKFGYWVSALERRGETTSSFKGLPKKFKTTDDAAEWLEGKLDEYEGDEFVKQAPASA